MGFRSKRRNKNRHLKRRTIKGGGDHCDVPNENRVDLFSPDTQGVTEENCKGKQGCWRAPDPPGQQEGVPLCYTSRLNVTVNLEGWENNLTVYKNSLPKQVLDELWALLKAKREPVLMPNGSKRWSACNEYCPLNSDKPKYRLKTSSGVELDNSFTLGESGIEEGDILIAFIP